MYVYYTTNGVMSSAKGKALNCPKCNGTMIEGYILEIGHRGGTYSTMWIEDPPVESWFRMVDIRRKRKYYIASYRCGACGFLEAYARRPVQP